MAKKRFKIAEIRQKRQFQRQEGKQLELLRRSDPKIFKSNSQITNCEFYEHFKNIAAEQTDKKLNISETLDSSIFSYSISKIENAISESKVDKSPGFDNIINEVFKNFSTFFTFVGKKLFNVILNSGCYQPAWSQGIIVPLCKTGM